MEFSIHRHGTIASTSELAFEAIEDGIARHGDVHVAAAQTKGRGRLGRRWHSAEGEGLYASVVLMPRAPLSPAGLTIAVGLAVRDAVTALGVERARLKWPNDVVVPAIALEKLAGILVETRGLDPERPHYVVGVGINVAQTSFPEELVSERAVTSLARCGIATSIDATLAALLAALPVRLEQIVSEPAVLARDYIAATELGRVRVRVVAGDRAIVGHVLSFDIERGLEIEGPDMYRHRFPLEIVREFAAQSGD